jgi:hypothetical protein
MAFIPYRKLTFDIHLRKMDAIERFRKAVFTHNPSPFYFTGNTDYLVNINYDHFSAKRLIRFPRGIMFRWRPILPKFNCKFINAPTGTTLLIKMYPSFFGALFVSILILVSLYLIIFDIREWLITDHPLYDGIGLLTAATLAYTLLVASFEPEMERLKTFLSELFQDKENT